MGRRKAKTKVATGPMQRLHDAEQVGHQQSELSVITPEQRAKGTYSEGRRIVNAHDPVERWKAAGRLTQGQEVAIALVQRLWRLTGCSTHLTANYGVSMGGGSVEHRALTEIEAREDLHRIQDYVPATYWSIFEGCCRFGEPAGVAGSRLGFGDRTAQERAHQVVCFVADIVVMKERL